MDAAVTDAKRLILVQEESCAKPRSVSLRNTSAWSKTTKCSHLHVRFNSSMLAMPRLHD